MTLIKPLFDDSNLSYEKYTEFLKMCYKSGFVANYVRDGLTYSTRHPEGYYKYKESYDLDRVLMKRYDHIIEDIWERIKVYG
jgi:hypothetical protein